MSKRTAVLKECREETAMVVRDLEHLGFKVYRVHASWPDDIQNWDFALENGTTLFPFNLPARLTLMELTGFGVYTSDHCDRKHRLNTGGKKYEERYAEA